MTKQDKIKFIREKCIEANEEIVELKFGCEIKITEAIDDKVYLDKERSWYKTVPFTAVFIEDFRSGCSDPECCGDMGTEYACVGKDIFTLEEIGDVEKYEIIGRPIHLADVLLAIQKRGEQWAIDDDGHIITLSGGTEVGTLVYEGTGKYWNLKETLNNQSKETIDFIYQLLN